MAAPGQPKRSPRRWWVTPNAYERGYYAKAHAALRHRVVPDYPLREPYFSNREIPDQT